MPNVDKPELEVAETVNPSGAHPVLLVCEHASAFIPDDYAGLGLSDEQRKCHIAWDPGALETARFMSQKLDAVLVKGNVSRLLYDCNRPPEAVDAIPQVSEIHAVPGNANLTAAQRRARVDTYYRPFETRLAQVVAAHRVPPVIVTMHSFTPVYRGVTRDVEIGILHDEDARLADAMLGVAEGFDIRRNEPYGPEDGVTHTLRRHALENGHLNVMIEIRNDLVTNTQDCRTMADHLCRWLEAALARLSASPAREVRA
ncbi:N-formylglutamate amidohydrolase [Tepidamorphus sp. 3E244]|uniref:N-formylglutamate amidohydrolase n=1 Tax=Tepidamorphus sp. 3E244 TaxID=3385498 RepID=UPI0038FC730A